MKDIIRVMLAACFLTVNPSYGGDLGKDLREIFSEFSSLRVEEAGKQIMVFGEVGTFQDFQRARQIAGTLEEKGELVSISIALSADGKKALAREIETAIGHPAIHVKPAGDTFVLEGVSENEFEADRAVEFTRAHLNYPMKAELRALSSKSGGAFAIVDMLRIAPRLGKNKK